MNITELPISILDNIFSNINDTFTFSNTRLTCKSFYFLLKESIRFFVRHFFSKHTPKCKPKTIYAVYVCILILYSMPAGSTLWADQLFFIFLALNKKQDYKTLDG